jgi:formiminoglutamase
MRYPFLISIPHGGTTVPAEAAGKLALSWNDLVHYSDPATQTLYRFGTSVTATVDTPVSRMVADFNRPPLPLPPRDPDGIVKTRTIDGKTVWRPGQFPDLPLIHRILMKYYFPYHQRIDTFIDRRDIRLAFDCHSMLPVGSGEQKDAGKIRPLICLGNNGDRRGRAKRNSLVTCPEAWITALADGFREEFSLDREVAINNPFSGGFIANAHFWRKGVPWIQIEVNRSLYEPGPGNDRVSAPLFFEDPSLLREKILRVLTLFWDSHGS